MTKLPNPQPRPAAVPATSSFTPTWSTASSGWLRRTGAMRADKPSGGVVIGRPKLS